MSTPTIKVGQGNWGIKANNLLGYANTEKKFTPVEFTSTRALNTATRVNASGNIEIVNANIPRIDYFGGQASLLVEPSASNLALRSAGFEVSGTWSPTNVAITTGTTAAFTAPDGTMSAYSLADNATNGRHRVQQGSISITSGTTYNFSIFIKKNSSNRFLLLNANSAFNARAALNLDNLAITNINGSGAAIENYGNDWYRFSIRGTATATTANTTIFVQMQDAATDVDYIGNGSSFYIWGAQLETGSVATSYIPTTTAAVTRNADVISVSGAVSGSIGQTEGTMYWEGSINRYDRVFFALASGTSDTQTVRLQTTGAGLFQAIAVSGTVQCNISASGAVTLGEYYKIAFAYKENDFVLYINGTQRGIDPSGTLPTNLNSVSLCHSNRTEITDQRCRAAALYTTRLTNDQLAFMTQP